MRGDDKSDFSLRPDPTGAHDPIGAGPSDHSLRPDPTGEHDPLAHARRDTTTGGVADDFKDAAGQGASRLADLADQGRRKAADLADDARERASDALDDARTWVSDTSDEQRRRVTHLARRGRERIDERRSQVEAFVEEHPLLVGVVGLAAGLLLGSLIPRTRSEDRNIGPYADELRAQGLSYVREATHRGRAFVENALDPDTLGAAERAAHAPAPDDRKI